MTAVLLDQLEHKFERIILCDTEYFARDGREGNLPIPICVCIHEYRAGTSLSLWGEGLHIPSPIRFTDRDVFICYNAGAELGIFNILGWDLPTHTLDLLAVYRQERCLIPKEAYRFRLTDALQFYGIETPLTEVYKDEMHKLCMRGFPYTNEERSRILTYCMEDTQELIALLKRLPAIDLQRFLSYGPYMKAVTHMEQTGTPVCMRTYETLKEHWNDVKRFLQGQVNEIYPLFDDEGHFAKYRFNDYLRERGHHWERNADGSPKLDKEYFKRRAHVLGDEVKKIYERWRTVQTLKTFAPPVGDDGFCRTGILPFASQTSRNQPSNAAFIMGMASWLRSMLMAPPGHALVYADYAQQEFFISAVLSQDAQMQADYCSGDIYMTLAKRLYNLPPDATKKTSKECKEKRDLVKVMTLGTQYCMSAEGLSEQAGDIVNVRGRRFLAEFESRYRVFDHWKEGALQDFTSKGYAETVLGWRLYNGGVGNYDDKIQRHIKPNARSITNFPVQGTGADILRVACSLLHEAKMTICAPVHDAVLFMLPMDDSFSMRVHYALYLMMKASEAVLGVGNVLRVEAAIYPHGTYYTDSRGEGLWKELKNIPAIAALPQCNIEGEAAMEIKPPIAAVMRLFD